MVDKAKVEEAIKLLLEGIGEDVNREGLQGTPERIARMCEEIYGGLENEADNACFIRNDRIVSVTVEGVAVRRCSCSVPAVFDTLLVAPLHILGN